MDASNPFAEETTKIIDVLGYAISEIQSIKNPELGMLTSKIAMDLKRHKAALAINLGLEPDSIPAPHLEAKPLTSIMGRPVSDYSSHLNTAPVLLKTAEQIEVSEIKGRLEELYPRFLTTDTDELLDTVSDIELRGIAKRAGLPVTETNPKRIGAKFVEQIKAAIQSKNDLEAAGDVGSGTFVDDEEINLPALNEANIADGVLALSVPAPLSNKKADKIK